MNQPGVHKTANESGVRATEPLLFPRTLRGQRAERKEIKITRGLTPATNSRQPSLPCGKTEWNRGMEPTGVGEVRQRRLPGHFGSLGPGCGCN
jgi:hypothetical protein